MITLADLTVSLNGRFLPYGQDGSCSFSGITSQLIRVREKSVFFVLNPDPTAARRQIVLARLQGAAAVVSTVEPYIKNISCILVYDPAAAMKTVARYHRSRLSGTVIGITGSCGKTTTKELLYAMLRRTAPCTASPESSNILETIPFNLLAVEESDSFAILEVGIRHTGEMEQISAIMQPDIGIITNIGEAHLEGLGSMENVLSEKLKLFDHAAPGFTAFLNGDDPLLRTVKEIRGVKPHFFHAVDYSYSLPFAGEHFRSDVAAAACVARFLGVPETEINAAVRDFTLPEERCQFLTIGDCTVINDCFNANPLSMKTALELLSSCPGRRIAVLGDMLELGESAPEYHRKIGAFAAEKKIDTLVCIGELAENITSGAQETGFPEEYCACYPSVDAFLTEEFPFPPGSTILLKASHGMCFDRILRHLRQDSPCVINTI